MLIKRFIRHSTATHSYRTCAAALNNLSTAAELGSVELIFMNAVASVRHGRRLSMDFSLHGRRPTPKSGGDKIGKLLVRKT